MQTALIPAEVLPLLVQYRSAKSQAEIHTLFCEIEQIENTLTLSGRTGEFDAVRRVRIAIGVEHRATLHDLKDVSRFSIPNTYAVDHPIRVSHEATKAQFKAEAAKVKTFLDFICSIARLDETLAKIREAA